MTTLNVETAKRIEELRKKQGIRTRNQLATRAGIDHSTLDNLLNGKSGDPKLSTIYKIASSGLGMKMKEFFDFPEMDEVREIEDD